MWLPWKVVEHQCRSGEYCSANFWPQIFPKILSVWGPVREVKFTAHPGIFTIMSQFPGVGALVGGAAVGGEGGSMAHFLGMGPMAVGQGREVRVRVGRGSDQMLGGYCEVLMAVGPVAKRASTVDKEGQAGAEVPGEGGFHVHSSAAVQPPISFHVVSNATSCVNWPWRL